MHKKNLLNRLLAAYLVVTALVFSPLALADKYDGVTVTFDQPIEVVQKAAVDALTVVGVTIDKQEPALIAGKRKNKMGFMMGSGGEILSVALTVINENKTEAKIRTTKTFVGRAGQKVWDQTIIDEMNK